MTKCLGESYGLPNDSELAERAKNRIKEFYNGKIPARTPRKGIPYSGVYGISIANDRKVQFIGFEKDKKLLGNAREFYNSLLDKEKRKWDEQVRKEKEFEDRQRLYETKGFLLLKDGTLRPLSRF